jgi:ribonuclease VapC
MVIDSSALLAIVLEEPGSSLYASAISNSPTCWLSAASLVEASVVLMRRRSHNPIAVLDRLIESQQIVIVSVDHEQALLAREAFRRFGKGRHPAALNFGDCFSYALAKQMAESLLFKGDDFAHTDVVAA